MNVRVTVPEADIAQARKESGWTDTRTRVAFALYASGKSDAQVACLIGGVSRNAVIGKRNRAGVLLGTDPALAARPLAKFDNGGRAGKPRPPKPIVVSLPKMRGEPLPPHVDDAAISIEQRRSLVQLDDSCCRWPVGDPGQPGFFFCGAVAKRKGDAFHPYCASHLRRAHDVSRSPSRRALTSEATGHAWR